MGEQKSFKTRCKDGWNRHKGKAKVAVGVGITVVCGYILAKHWDDVIKLLDDVFDHRNVLISQEPALELDIESLTEPFVETVQSVKEITVRAHPMKLAAGKQASEKAKELADELNLVLLDNQTVRRASTRHIAA